MPMEIGLLSSQQDSFEHHEELSKLLTETEVFYVPLRNELGEIGLNTNQDLTDLTKRFDEDLSNKHLIVTFRDIGYSLFLDSVQSIPDEADQSKIRVSGKMIVDGICIQFFGCFDHNHKTEKYSVSHTQQINGVGRVELDEGYYRELSLTQTSLESHIEDDGEKQQIKIEHKIKPKTRQQTAKLKERTDTNKQKIRPRTISESVLPKKSTTLSKSPPPPPLSIASTSTSRPRIHSPGHMPYPLRSPRSKQHRPSSPPVHMTTSPTTRTSEVHPSSVTVGSSSFNEYPPINSTPTPLSSVEYPQAHRIQIVSHPPPPFSSHPTGHSTMPIQIPTSSNTGFPTTSLPQVTSVFPMTQSQSLPTYIFPTTNFAYITTAASTTNPNGTPFDFTPITGNTSLVLIANPNQYPSQPLHFLTPIDHRSLQFTHYATANLFPPTFAPSRISNILQSTATNESMSILQHKRHENEEDKQFHPQQTESNKQTTGQLPFKKRRYTGQQTRMATVHDGDDEVSDVESTKK